MALRDVSLALRRYVLIAIVVTIALTAAAMWLAYVILKPTPSRTVAMGIDEDGGVTARLGVRYQELLAQDGIELKLVPSVGAVENLARLRDAKSGVSIAIVPSGITNQKESPGLVSLGTLFYEPLWLFYDAAIPQKTHLRDSFRGKRIAIGPEGSAGHWLFLHFLARSHVIEPRDTTLLPLTPEEAGEKLLHREIDAAVFLSPWDSPLIHRLLAADNITLGSLPRADAWVALFPYLNKVVVLTGVADMAENRPPNDVVLVAPKASLVIRKDLHPAIQYLLLEAAAQIHSEPGMFNKAGQFPAPEAIDLPLSQQATQFYKTGRPFLQRHLPFWLAVQGQQVLVVLIPIVAVMYPLLRLAPAVYAWSMRRRIFHLYGELKFIEVELEVRGGQTAQYLLVQLDRLEQRANQMWIPVAFAQFQYALRMHINLVRAKLQQLPNERSPQT